MKVLIPVETKITKDNFESARLNKSIKGALELNNVFHTSNPLDYFDVVHLVSSEEELLLLEAIEDNKPVIISALMCENDPDAAFLDFKYKDGNIRNNLLPKSLKFLNKSSHVLVPCESARALLIGEGVTSPITIIPPGINFSSFDYEKEEEKNLFYRYFREEKSKKLIVAVGDYDSLDGINAFIDAAKKCPDAIFYFFGHASSSGKMNRKIKSLIKKAPKNAKFKGMVQHDIYHSALMNAVIFMVPGYKKAGFVSLLEAMAAKCQLIVREQALFPDFLNDGENAYIAKFSETLSSLAKDFLDGKLHSTTLKAYEMAKKASLTQIGERLDLIYKQELKRKK